MDIPQDFLFQDPSFWNSNEAYITYSTVQDLKKAESGKPLSRTGRRTNTDIQCRYI